jgi:hypothetical protein
MDAFTASEEIAVSAFDDDPSRLLVVQIYNQVSITFPVPCKKLPCCLLLICITPD